MSLFGPDLSVPDMGGWQTGVKPGAGDPNNLSFAEKLRMGIYGSTDAPAWGPAASKAMGAVTSPFTAPQEAAKTAGPAAPGAQAPKLDISAMTAQTQMPKPGQPGPAAAPGPGAHARRGSIYGPFGPA